MMRRLTVSVIIIFLIFIIPFSISQTFRDITRNATFPTIKIFFRFGQKIRYPLDWMREINQIRDENSQLKSRVAKLLNQVIQVEELKKENQSLRSELELRPDIERFQRVVATVISYGSPGNSQTLIIDQGKKSGVNVGDAVIASGYLVGKVSQSYRSSANVILITNRDSIIQAQISGSGEKGIVTGDISGIYLSEITVETQINQGLVIETSGLGGSMPAGLLIGETTNQKSLKEQAKNSVRLRSSVNINNLAVVFVLTKINND